jgi:hypothetical protein
MSAICKPNCVTVLPNFGSIDQCDIEALLTSGEIINTLFAKCNEPFTDIDSPTEWQDKINAGLVTIPYTGNGKIDEQAETGEVRIGCQTINTICKRPFEYTSPIVDTTSQTDYLKYNQINKQRLGLGVMHLTCDGILLINPSWITGKSPAIKLSSIKISQIFSGEADSKMTYKINGEMLGCDSLMRVKLSDDTIDVITAGIVTSGLGGL